MMDFSNPMPTHKKVLKFGTFIVFSLISIAVVLGAIAEIIYNHVIAQTSCFDSTMLSLATLIIGIWCPSPAFSNKVKHLPWESTPNSSPPH